MKPKSIARVKNCSAPSMRRAASSSCVRMTAQRIALFGANQILTAFAAGERQITRPDPAPARQVSQQRCVLIVRVRRDHQNAAHHVQPIERESGLRRSRQLALREGWGETRADKNG